LADFKSISLLYSAYSAVNSHRIVCHFPPHLKRVATLPCKT